MSEIGDNVVRMDQLIQETQSFRQSCDEDVERASSVIENGRSIIENNDKSSSKDTVEPKCNELNRMLEMFNEKVSKRIETLTNAHRLMERVEKANEWCAKGIDLLASQRIENMSLSSDIAEAKLQDILAFVESAKDFELSSLKDLKSCQEENTSLETIILSQVSKSSPDTAWYPKLLMRKWKSKLHNLQKALNVFLMKMLKEDALWRFMVFKKCQGREFSRFI